MAKFGTPQTRLEDPNFGAARATTQGVVDRSGALRTQATTGLIKDVGELGVQAMEGYALANLEKKQEEVIEDYMGSKKNPQIASDAALNVASLENTENSLWNRPDVEFNDIDAVETAHKAQLSKYKAAVDQGVMSPGEFADRTLAVTREAVNKNPGLYEKLLGHSQKVLELSGISTIVKEDIKAGDEAAKAQQKQLDNILSIAKAKDIPVPYRNGNIDWATLKAKTDSIQLEDQAASALNRAANMRGKTAEIEADNFARQYGVKGATGKLNQGIDFATGIIADPKGSYADKISLVRSHFDGIERELMDSTAHLSHLPNVKATLDYFQKQKESIVGNLEKYGSQEDAAKYLKNTTEMLRNNQYQDISSKVNPEAVKLIGQIGQFAGLGRILDKDPQAAAKIMDSFSNIVSGVTGGLGTDYAVRDATGAPAIARGVSGIAQEAGKGDVSSIKGLNTYISTIHADTRNDKKFPDTASKFKFYEGYIKEIGNPLNKDGFKKLDDVSRAKVSENLAEYMHLTLSGLKDEAQKLEKQNIKITVDVLPDGRLSLQTSDSAATEMLTKRFVVRANDGLKALVNILGVDSTLQAADHFYPTYKDYFNTTSAATKPTKQQNIPTVEDTDLFPN